MLTKICFADFDVGVFPTGYAPARQRWLFEMSRLAYAYKHSPFSCAGAGPDAEILITDSVWIRAEDTGRVVVVLAGTHGIEGFTGSAVQIDILRLLAAGHLTLPEDTALLLIHALTPWGYAWLRRCDADGVDLNRNIVDFSGRLPENPGYESLRTSLFQADVEKRRAVLSDYSRQYGQIALEKALSGGQYHDPSGPFFGGGRRRMDVWCVKS